jgi:Leucine-rich repeat (LRR) protein
VINLNEASVSDLSALSEFVRLRELSFAGTGIKSIPAVASLQTLKLLHATNSPLQNIEFLSKLDQLEDLDISNTAVEDLKPIGALKNLRRLNCAGTQIKKIEPLSRLDVLEWFDCSNTRVSNIEALWHLPLKTLKVYNTKISAKEVSRFKEINKECQVVYYR